MKPACIICGESRYTERAHIFPRCFLNFNAPDKKEYQEVIVLCPTHHKLYDNFLLNDEEFEKVMTHSYERIPALCDILLKEANVEMDLDMLGKMELFFNKRSKIWRQRNKKQSLRKSLKIVETSRNQ